MTGARASALPLGAIALAWVLPAAAQSPTPVGSVTDSARVSIVNVEVQVTDRTGRAVPGLTAADFQLFEDGKAVALTNFYVGDGFAAPAEPAPGPTAAALTSTAVPSQTLTETQALHLVVLVDGLNIGNVSRNVAIDAIAAAIESRLRQGDDVLIASFDRTLRIRCPLTTNVKGAAAALRAIKKEGSEGQFFATDRIQLLDRMLMVEPRGPEDQRAIREDKLLDTEVTIQKLWALEQDLFESAGQLVDSLAGLSGRKALLFVSEGLPTQVGRAVFDELAARFVTTISGSVPVQVPSEVDRTRYNLNAQLSSLGVRANAGRVTFYPVDARLYRGLGAVDAETLQPAADFAAASMDSIDKSLSLLGFAKATGGEVLYSTMRLDEQLGAVLDGLDSFYSLGFSPSHTGDWKYHRLEVKVRREGLRLRYREGYLDKPEAVRQTDRTAAALLRGGYANPLGLEAEVGPAVHGRGKTLKIPLTVSLPARGISLLPDQEGLSGKLVFSVASKDMQGRHSEPFSREFVIPVPPEQAVAIRSQRLVFTFDVVLREGEYALAITARDEIGQIESTVTLAVTALAPTAS